jgi:Flp pilus assembly protein TadD
MKQINQAYDIITKERSSKGSSDSQNTYYNPYHQTETEIRVRKLINEGRISEADVLLDRVQASEKGAEWNFLKACVCIRKGWLMEARNYSEKAVRMEPNNPEYNTLYRNIMNTSRGTSSNNCSMCDICTALMCIDCMCGGCR